MGSSSKSSATAALGRRMNLLVNGGLQEVTLKPSHVRML
jgi:hypothetical protein